MPEPDLVADIQKLRPTEFVARWFDERVPFLFGTDRSAYVPWRRHLATALGVSLFDIILVGSAALGRSLNPEKALAPFQEASDVDVAVISPHHFDIAWRWMRRLGADRYRLPSQAQEWVKEHEKRLVYWGAIATDQLLHYMPFGPDWVKALAAVSSVQPVDGRTVNVRLYRDHSSMEAYLVESVRKARNAIDTGPKGGTK